MDMEVSAIGRRGNWKQQFRRATLREQIYSALANESQWLTAPQLAARHNLSVKAVTQYLGRLASYGRIGRVKIKGYPILYRVNKHVDRSVQDAINRPREDYDSQKALFDAFMLGQITKQEYAEALD